MFTETSTESFREGYSLGEFLSDAAVGAGALIAIIILALVLGGFSFFTPWLIVSPPLLFAAGMMRGSDRGNIWIKGLSISVASLLLLGFCANALTFALGMVIAVLPAVGGVWFRRLRLARSEG